MDEERLELSRTGRRFLRPVRLPFRHSSARPNIPAKNRIVNIFLPPYPVKTQECKPSKTPTGDNFKFLPNHTASNPVLKQHKKQGRLLKTCRKEQNTSSETKTSREIPGKFCNQAKNTSKSEKTVTRIINKNKASRRIKKSGCRDFEPATPPRIRCANAQKIGTPGL